MTKKQVVSILTPFVLGIIVGGGILVWMKSPFCPFQDKRSEKKQPSVSTPIKKGGKTTLNQKKNRVLSKELQNRTNTVTSAKKPKVVLSDDLPADLKNNADLLQEALDNDNAKEIVKYAHLLLESGNKDARMNAMQALVFAGWDGFPELAAVLFDEDKDVAEEARSSWQLLLNSMDSSPLKKMLFTSVAEVAVNTDPEFFETIIFDASLEMTDNEMLTFLLPLYSQTTQKESQQLILETIDGITSPETESKSLEDAQYQVNLWQEENADIIEEEQNEQNEQNE